MINNLTILCPSCANFSDMWENQLLALNTYWKSHPDVFLVTDNLPTDFISKNKKIIVINEQYSDRLIFALKRIESKFVLLTLDDYLIDKKINDEEIAKIINYMETNDIDYCKLRKAKYGRFVDKKNKIKKLSLKYTYEVSLLPGLWKRESLLKALQSNLTPWQTEVSLTNVCKKQLFKCVAKHSNKIYPYVDVVRKGKYLRKGFRYIKRNNYFVSERKVMPLHESVIRFIKQLAFNLIPLRVREKISKKKGNKSFSGSNSII